jgi:hypothetical protein
MNQELAPDGHMFHVWYVHYYLTRQLLDSNPRWVNPDVTCSRWALPCVCLHQIEEADGCIMVMVMDDASPSSAGTTHVSCVRRSQKACGHSRAEFFFLNHSRAELNTDNTRTTTWYSCRVIVYTPRCACACLQLGFGRDSGASSPCTGARCF